MIQLKPVFHSKIGNNRDTNKIIYKYYFGSIEPHFYFVAYIFAYEDTYDIFYIPQVGNIHNTGIVEFGDNKKNAKYGVEYGEQIEIILTNKILDGYGEFVVTSLSLNEVPVAINSSNFNQSVLDEAIKTTDREISYLKDISLYTLANIIAIEVESKLDNIMTSSAGIKQKNAVNTIIKNTLSVKKMFTDNLPKTMTIAEKDFFYKLYMRVLNIAPYTNSSTAIFADSILFSRLMKKDNIDLSKIPYLILFNLMIDWMINKHNEQLRLIKKAALNVIHKETISLNMSTMEDDKKVYELLQKTQDFIYLKKVVFTNEETKEKVEYPLDNEYYKNYIKSTNKCIEEKGLQSTNGVFYIQYGYGKSCDGFVGLYARNTDGKEYGLRRDDKLVDNSYVTSRTYAWENKKVIKTEGIIDSSNNISVDLIGV